MLWICPWCEEVGYEESDDDDEDDEEIDFEICADCLLDNECYFIFDVLDIFEFLREVDQYSEWDSSIAAEHCEVA